MKIIRTAQFNLRNPDEINDDLGLSSDYKEDLHDDWDIKEPREPDEENFKEMAQKGEGVYYSITDDRPEGPFKTVADAKKDLEMRVKAIVKQDRHGDSRFWYENANFSVLYYYNGKPNIDDLGNYYEATD